MRLWTVPALLAALLSTAAAQACFFKCCFKSASSDDRKVETPTSAIRFLTIVSVDGKLVDMTATPNVNNVNPSHDIDVVVNADYLTGSDPDHIDLVLTEIGPRTGTKVATAAGGKKHHKLKWKALVTVSTTAAAPGMAAGTTRYWECHFTLPCMPSPELQANYKYTLQAFYPDSPPVQVQSTEVSVWTAP